ncbi:hypothetical protein LWI29_002445 [Acer saccharum]|uniref:Subtilisin-like protease SBT1.1 n=1 Tax=Acer saccharum TaxID=4024 RepID=A0AA39VJM5_ACESA|nr:hypothetical protein LWI29_002445 [Acer saccharum]
MFGKNLLFLVLVVTTASIGTAMAKSTYIIHMDKTKMASNLFRQGDSIQTYQAVIDSINEMSLQEDDKDQQEETILAELLYAYESAISGFSARLSTKQLQSLKKVDGFLSATPDQMLQLHTTNSKQFLGLQNGKGLLSASNSASDDVIIGIIDTGIWPEHVSFQDTGMSAVPSRWKGVCDKGIRFSKSNCNKKLIGARAFFKGYEADQGKINEAKEFRSARDEDGHGKALTKQVPVAYLESAGSPASKFCLEGTLNETLVKGKIVVCHRGSGSAFVKSENVKQAKGVGMILINSKSQGDELSADTVQFPTARLGMTLGKFVRQYASTAKKPTASIIFKGTVFGRTAPVIARFSSRGPCSIEPDVIKPDVTAPGVNILAAWPPTLSPVGRISDKRSAMFKIISGTSMSCPHVSGLAALLKSVHRDWSPAAIKSALMTTAYTLNNKKSPIGDVDSSNSAGPFAYGSGHVDPERAADPGLIYDITAVDYLKYICSLNYTSAEIALFTWGNFTCLPNAAIRGGELNYPSFAVNFRGGVQNGSLEYKRTVTNVGSPTSSYALQMEVPNGVSVIVKPKILSFNKLGQKLSYKVTFVGKSKRSSDSSFGSLTWVSGKFKVRSPIAVTWQ